MIRIEALLADMVASAPQVQVRIRQGKTTDTMLKNQMGEALLVRNLLHGADDGHVHRLAMGVVIFSAPTTKVFPATTPGRVRCLTLNLYNKCLQCQSRW